MVLTDDSHYDFLPVPGGWQWEDLGNYYGAGVYGLSAFDNSMEIHLKTTSDSTPVIVSYVFPGEYRFNFKNRLAAAGKSDEGYIYAAPYSSDGWIAGTVPAPREDFVLKGSIADPPLLISEIFKNRLEAGGIEVKGGASTSRLEMKDPDEDFVTVSEIYSPPLFEIIEVLNHESVNLYAENMLKELGKKFMNEGSTAAGIEVVKTFLQNAGIRTDGMFIHDGSGLSPMNAINSGELVNLLVFLKNHGKYFNEYISSLPVAGKEGTLKYCFRDPVFETSLRAKSGSMTRVRCYAGYIRTKSNRNLAFSFLVNNFTGHSDKVISGIEKILMEIILYK